MSSFKDFKLTHLELINWKRNPNINPRTLRRIKTNGALYKYFNKKYEYTFPNKMDPLDSVDNRDPITLNIFWTQDRNVKKMIHQNIENLIVYRDEDGLCRCFELESLEYMKAYHISKHPVTGLDIPKDVLDSVREKKIDIIKTIDDKALEVFQLFINISIFIDYQTFLELDTHSLLKFNYEIRDFYYKNLDDDSRSKIDGSDGTKLLTKCSNELNFLEYEEIQTYLLDQMKIMLGCQDANLKYMINYIILGGLGLVIPEVKENYPDFSFNFD